jgi:hypothetical protein
VFDYDAPPPEADAEAIAADIGRDYVPDKEPDEDRDLRIVEHELRESRDRERRAEAQARYEFDHRRQELRRQQAARAEALRARKEKMALQQRERDAQLDRDRVAAVAAQQLADMERRSREAQAKRVTDHWREIDQLMAGLDRLCSPPPPDFTAQRVAALEYELQCQADQAAAADERSRAARYRDQQAAAVARREQSGGW